MATITAAASETWVRPSDFMKDVSGYVNTTDGAQDSIEAIANVFDWMAHLGINESFAKHTSETLEPLEKTLSIPSFFGSLGSLRNNIQKFSHSDDSDISDLWNSTMITGIHGSKSLMALDCWGVCSLKESMKGVKTFFWTALIGLDSVGLYLDISEANHLQKTIDCTNDPKLKNIYEHKLQNTHLKVLKNAVIVAAMAPLCLISILFASMATGLFFHPVVMLSLTSVWCMLNFVTYFYEKAIDRWENDYNMLKG